MRRISSRLRILGNDHDVMAVKAFLDSSKTDEKNVFDLTKVTSASQSSIENVHVYKDMYTFDSDVNLIHDIQMLSVDFKNVKLSYTFTEVDETNEENHHHVETERHSYLIKDGIIIGQTSHTSVKDDYHVGDEQLLQRPEYIEKNRDMETRHDLMRLKEDFFMETNAFMDDISRSFFNLWF